MLRLGLQADETPGKWMMGVSLDPRDLPLLDMDQDPAFTVRGLTTSSDYFFHDPPLPSGKDFPIDLADLLKGTFGKIIFIPKGPMTPANGYVLRGT